MSSSAHIGAPVLNDAKCRLSVDGSLHLMPFREQRLGHHLARIGLSSTIRNVRRALFSGVVARAYHSS
jgi:hypothetical protein